MSLLDDFARALSQFTDPRFQKVFWKSLLLAFVLVMVPFFGITALLDWVLPETVTLPWVGTLAIHGGLLSVAGILTFFLLSFLMFPVASVIIGFYLEEISDAVEARYYPQLPPAKPAPFFPMLLDSLKFTVIIVAANILVLAFYLMASVFAPLVFWGVNGYLMGREYFQLVAARRVGMKEATRLRKRYLARIWLAGFLMAIPLSVPLVNLVIPIFGVAVFTHQFHRLYGDA